MDKTIRFNAIMREIMKLENGSNFYCLFQFQSFVSASQYLRLYNLFTKSLFEKRVIPSKRVKW